jgi:hypothetical protein
MRELTNAELDTVGGGGKGSGGLMSVAKPRQPDAPIVKLVEEIVVDILRILEPKPLAAVNKQPVL